jgi:hypothetical protein
VQVSAPAHGKRRRHDLIPHHGCARERAFYYWYPEELGLIEIRSFWGAKREHGPEL